MKQEIKITNSVNTDTAQQDIYLFGDASAPLLKNNGIERDGGVTNVYEVETDLPPNSTSYITPEGDVISRGWDGLVKLKGMSLGYVNKFSIQDMCSIRQVDDVILSSYAKTYITAKLVGNTIELAEYNIPTTPVSGNPFGDNEITYDSAPPVGVFPSSTLFPSTTLYPSGYGAAEHTLSFDISITGVTNIGDVYTSLSIVRQDTFGWAETTKEFVIRIGDDVYLLSETNPTAVKYTALLSGFTELNYLYVYKYGVDKYLVNLVGNKLNKSFIVTSWAVTKTDIRCRYAIPQSKSGYTRHLVTCDPLTDANKTAAVGYVGYTAFSAPSWSATVVSTLLSATYKSASYTQPTSYNTGFGYSEYVIKTIASSTWTNVYSPNFVTDLTIDGTTSCEVVDHATQSNNTELLWNYYGKLNNFGGVVPSRPMEFRVNVVNGVQSYISVAGLDSTYRTSGSRDMLGVNLTEIGAFDDTYTPQIMNDNTILFRALDNFYVVAIDYDAGAGYFNSSNWDYYGAAADYSAGTTYSANAMVLYNTNEIYRSLVGSNIGNTPDSSPTYWRLISSGIALPYNTNGVINSINQSTTPNIVFNLETPLMGGQYPYIIVRYKTNDPSNIILQYANSVHDFDPTYQNSKAVTADGEWHVLEFNMLDATVDIATRADWSAYAVTKFQLQMGSTIGAAWELFQVYMSYKDIKYVPQVQKISDAAYKINTIGPLNIVNIRTGLLEPGSMDYHGQMKFSYSGAQATVPYRVTSQITSVFANSADTGEKIINCDLNVSTPQTVIDPIGTRVTGNINYAVDIYCSPTTSPASTPIYSFSILESGTELQDPSKLDTPYQSNLVLPIPVGYRYNQFACYARSSTIFYNTTNPISIGYIGQGTSVGYDGYTIGNDIPGTYVPFQLLGTRYIQDLNYIYQVDFQNNIYNGHTQIAPSIGMLYLGTAPDIVYFLSNFDNSIYTFTGNRTLVKANRMSQCDIIENGLYSTKDNTLLLNATNSFIWIRDNIVTINEKKYNQSGDMTIFETRDGLIAMNEYNYWAYTYNQINFDAIYTLVPLELQTAHFAVAKTQKSILSEFVYTIQNVQYTKKASFNVIVYSKDENDNYIRQQRTITLWPKDFNSEGYASFRVKPASYRSVATSVYIKQIGTDIPKVLVLDVVAELAPDTSAVIAARKTR